MISPMIRLLSALAVGVLALPLGTAPAQASGKPSGDLPPTEIMPDDGPVTPMKNKSQITITRWGYRYTSGQQHNRLTVTESDGGLLYTDKGTAAWRQLPSTCTRHKVAVGIEAWCSIPPQFADTTMFLEIHPRLGNDHIDGRTLSAKFRFWVLTDKGHDRVWLGAGDDFANGYTGVDRVYGGLGDDWIRGGLDDDFIYGGDGEDYLLGLDDGDYIDGGTGADDVFCGTGKDTAVADGYDHLVFCENRT